MTYRKSQRKSNSLKVRLGQFRVRRPKSLIAYFDGSEFKIENYLSNRQVEISPFVASLLQRLDKYRTINSVLRSLGSMPQAEQVVHKLIANDLLVIEGTAVDIKDRLIEQSWNWGQDIRYYHYASQFVKYEGDVRKQRAILAKLAGKVPPPSPYKNYKRSGIKLGGSYGKDGAATELWKVLLSRRTRRSFLRKKISFHDFSTLLLWTWGKTHTIKSEIGENVLKTSPSGGARHPIEVYPVVLRVQGIEPGIYHYSVKRNELECIKKGMFQNLVLRLCSYQKWIRDAAAVFFMTAVLARTMWKYNHSHAYRVILLDAGHLGQTFHLVSTNLGLAPFSTAATNDKAIEVALGIDGITEIPVYTVAVGLPDKMRPNRSIAVIPSSL
ncbi:MAG: SagB/ThcOx family dehydrogenase [Nitrososphaera sp.]